MVKLNTKKKSKPLMVPSSPMLSDLWVSLGFPYMGRPVHVAFTLYETGYVETVVTANTKKFQFTSLASETELLTLSEVIALPDDEKENQTLGVVILTDLRRVDNRTLVGDTLPFVPGADRSWRNPKQGHLAETDESIVTPQWVEKFAGFEKVIKVEQVMTPAGYPDDVDQKIDKALTDLI